MRISADGKKSAVWIPQRGAKRTGERGQGNWSRKVKGFPVQSGDASSRSQDEWKSG